MTALARVLVVGLVAATTALAGCGSTTSGSGASSSAASGTGSASATPTDEMPTASYSPPSDDATTPPEDIVLNNTQPNDGPAPVVAFINSATKSIDVSIYRIDSDYSAIVDPLVAQAAKGIPVRISISRQLVGQPNPPEGNATQLQVQKDLQAKGLKVELSRPEFHYGHEKAIIIDAGTPSAKAMIADWNLQQSYFSANQYGPVGARGFAVVDSNSADVDMISSYFNANWPPYKPWPVSNRANLVWSPSGTAYSPVGNGVAALTQFVNNAKKTLDVYAEYIQTDSFMLPLIIDRAKAGVKVRMIGNSSGQPAEITSQLRAAGVQMVFDPTNAAVPDATMFVHSKTMIADFGQPGQVAFVGSQNEFINESLEAILELGALVKDDATIKSIQKIFDTDFARSTEKQAPPSAGAN